MTWELLGAVVFGATFTAAGWVARGWTGRRPEARHRSVRHLLPAEPGDRAASRDVEARIIGALEGVQCILREDGEDGSWDAPTADEAHRIAKAAAPLFGGAS